MAMKESVYDGIATFEMVQPQPQLFLRLREPDGPTVVVDGLSPDVAVTIPWKKIIEAVLGSLGGTKNPDGGCTTIKITNPNGSTTEIKQCPPPT